MALFNSISIQHNFATVLTIDKKRDSLTIVNDEVLETSELKDYLLDKKNIYLSTTQDDILDEEVTIPSIMKNDKVIKNIILNKLKDTLSSTKVLLNYTKLSEDENDATATYAVVGVYEKEYLKIFKHISDTNEVKSATISRYSLFAISQECLKVDSYLSVYTQSNKIMILAVEDNKLVGYIRASSVIVSNPMERHNAMIEEINRTIAYITQQYRDINFSTISLSGSIAVDDLACENIAMLSNIPISVLYPNTIFKGLEDEEFQHNILALGNYFVDKRLRFIPSFVIGIQQFLIAMNASLVVSILAFFTILYFAYDASSQYDDTLVKYEGNKKSLVHMIQKTSTYSDTELQMSLAHIEIAEKYLQHYPTDIFLLLKPLLELHKPTSVSWTNRDENTNFKITFKKSFDSLEGLYIFEKTFNELFDDINSSQPLQNENKTNYTTLVFEAIVGTQEAKKKAQSSGRRRRRRP